MKLEVYKPLWGHEGPLELAVEQAVAAEFDGIEGSAPPAAEREHFQANLKASELQYIGEIFTGGNYVPDASASPKDHLEDLERKLAHTLPLDPIFINTQTGLDAWPLKTKIAYCESLLHLAQKYEITISIELHRSRMTYSPWVTQELVDALPELPLTIDFSHWCCVAERLVMDDEPALLDQLARQTQHIHARVGYDQGPQVPDPRAPEYQDAVAAHLKWWQQIWQIQRDQGRNIITMTPEFGTDGYLHLEPYTQSPVANLWEINQWMAQTLRQNWHSSCNSDTRSICE